MNMKVVVIGGTGLIGSKVVERLKAGGYEAVAAAPQTGVNTLTGEGLADVLKNASVLVDVSNSPSFEEKAVMHFFQTSTRNLIDQAKKAGVKHYVALSVVGTSRLKESPYFRAKIAQEKLIQESSLPYTIVHATQFFEFVKMIADAATNGNQVRLAPVLIQPMAAEDVAFVVSQTAASEPANGIVETGGPERFRLGEFVAKGLAARNDPREVISDPETRYFGARLEDRTLIPSEDAALGEIRFDEWLQPAAMAK